MSRHDLGLVEPWRKPLKPDITHAISELTDKVVTYRVVSTMIRGKTLSKFSELAARGVSIRKSLDDRADKLAKRLDAIPTLADAAFTKHETILDETEQGIKALEDSLRDMVGHNGSPLSDSHEG